MKAQQYKETRPAEHFTSFHERTRRQRPGWTYELTRMGLTLYLLPLFRARCIDSQHVPDYGPVIVAPNHFSFLDHFFAAVFLRRKMQFMSKSQLFKPPMQFIYTHGGVFPVMRGHRDQEAFITARTILERGGVVTMYAEGGRSRTGELGEPKAGIGRLALETGAPVVPTAIAGSAKVRDWKRLQFPKVTIQYGTPFRFERVEHPTRDQAMAASEVIFEEIRALYGGLQAGGRRRAVRASRAARRGARARAHPATD